jgi:hypothetical protein
MIPIPKGYVRVAMCLSKYQFLDYMSILPRACACEHHEFMAIGFSFYNLQFGLHQIELLLNCGHFIHNIVVVSCHSIEFIDLFVDKAFFHVQISQIIDLLIFNVVFHSTYAHLFFCGCKIRDFLFVLLLDAFDESTYLELELPDSGVDNVERIAGIVVGIHFELDETCRDELIYDGGCLVVL